jgi:hypothetical protein
MSGSPTNKIREFRKSKPPPPGSAEYEFRKKLVNDGVLEKLDDSFVRRNDGNPSKALRRRASQVPIKPQQAEASSADEKESSKARRFGQGLKMFFSIFIDWRFLMAAIPIATMPYWLPFLLNLLPTPISSFFYAYFGWLMPLI